MAATRTDRYTPSLIDPPELQTALVADVAPIRPVEKVYSYLVPRPWADALAPGMRVTVPFGRSGKPAVGFCIGLSERPWKTTLKPIIGLIDEAPVLGATMLSLGRWIARYYAAPIGRTLDLMVPSAAKNRVGWKSVKFAVATVAEQADDAATVGSLTAKQAKAWRALNDAGGRLETAALCDRAECGGTVIAALARKGLVHVERQRRPRAPDATQRVPEEPGFELTPDQRAATHQTSAAVAARQFSVQVLFGVTGSGKTEVYVSTIRQVVAGGGQAIMLVPEIALTTQTVARLEKRFSRVAVLHSGLAEGSRAQTWAAIAAGEIPVIIGTRSAIFAPCPNLGVIIVDEEAESSYKNLSAPRFHTRDVAVLRARLENVPVVLGSATPSLETWKNVHRRAHYHLISMPTRVRGLSLPTLYLVDMRVEHLARPGVHMLSREMEAHLKATLDRGEQAVLLLNRRGYAGYLHCPKCKTVVTCPRCSVHMVFHATTQLAHCHYCHNRVTLPKHCPVAACDGQLVRFGIGTQRVEEEMSRKFPEARVRRMDSDAMHRPRDYADVLGAFERREFDVLVGTQMIARGLDFPFVSFVGVVSADTALGIIDDFRSEERTFQLVLQVAGRSGRGALPGHVVVQTFAADTAPIRHALRQDYAGFADQELEKRRRMMLPPWTRMVRIVLADRSRSRAAEAGQRMTEGLRLCASGARIDGPLPSPIERIRGRYRFDILLTFDTADAMLAGLDRCRAEGVLRARVQSVVIDVDPISLQ
jgi:primosomal protein N' (replication factor Y)